MSIVRNSAKCTACGVQVVSESRHDFRPHYCKVEPEPGLKWDGEGRDAKLVPSGEITFRFAVDGGKDYARRLGHGFVDTSLYE